MIKFKGIILWYLNYNKKFQKMVNVNLLNYEINKEYDNYTNILVYKGGYKTNLRNGEIIWW